MSDIYSKLSYTKLLEERKRRDEKKIDEKIPAVLEWINLNLFNFMDSTNPNKIIQFETTYEFLQRPENGGLSLSDSQIEELHNRIAIKLLELGWNFETRYCETRVTGYEYYNYIFTPLKKAETT